LSVQFRTDITASMTLACNMSIPNRSLADARAKARALAAGKQLELPLRLAERPCVCGAYPDLEWSQCPGHPEWGISYCG
jgi:hypothetical protein